MLCVVAWNSDNHHVSVKLGDYEMHGKGPGGSATVHKGKVRTILERKRGVIVSEHGLWRTRWSGGVWIPKALPEYEHLKSVAETWKAPETSIQQHG
jgi:hypothetical protein